MFLLFSYCKHYSFVFPFFIQTIITYFSKSFHIFLAYLLENSISMSELEKTEKYDNAKISFIIDLDQLHPIGYIYKNGERYPILLVMNNFLNHNDQGGKTYSISGNITIKSKSRSSLDIYKVKVSVEGKLVSILNENTATEAIIEESTVTHTINRSISKSLVLLVFTF